MNQAQLKYFNSWLVDYSKDFLSGDSKVDANIQFKIDHTYRVRDNSLAIAVSLDLSPEEKRIAELVALFHDVGRFEQFTKYGTFKDSVSEDHAELGLKVLARYQVLSKLLGREKNIVEVAIKYHNKYSLSQLVPVDCLMFCKLIRDADKIDIFEQLLDEVSENHPNQDGCSPEVIDSILGGKVVPFSDVKTPSDIILMRMSWILDVNYSLTLQKFKDKQLLEKMAAKLPLALEIQTVCNYLTSYIEQRLKVS